MGTNGAYPIDRIRSEFPILSALVRGKPLVYLDNGASAQKPEAVIDQIKKTYETEYANVHRGVHFMSQKATDAMEAARVKVQAFLNAAEEKEIIFVRGATEGINLVASSWGRSNLQEGDEIVLSVLEHHSNIVPWQIIAEQTGAVINVKKGQFLAPWDMPNIIAKIESTGNQRLLLTERGTSFGYNTLVADMRALPQMAQSGYPVVMDATHSVAQPGGKGTSSGGQREFAPVMARAAVALGIAAVFIETHENPDTAPSDGPNMIVLDQMPALISTLMQFDRIAKANPITL